MGFRIQVGHVSEALWKWLLEVEGSCWYAWDREEPLSPALARLQVGELDR